MPSPDGRIDLRSDTVTTPTREMRRAMADAEVGDDVYGEDPSVNRFQEHAADLLGKEAALYVPTGTMANQAALRALGRPGTSVVCAARAHVNIVEGESTADAGLRVRLLPDSAGSFEPSDLARAFAEEPPVSVVAIENTAALAGGRLWRLDDVAAVCEVAETRALPVHCDGARIWNASIALDVGVAELVGPATTAMFCISKGLGAPVGSVLCGPGDIIVRAHAWRRRLGGAMRQAGVIAAAGLVALDTMVDRLADDHRRARHLAEALADAFPGSVDPATVDTNIVCAAADCLPTAFLEQLRAGGVWALRLGEIVRLVTHKDVDDDDLERVVGLVRELKRELA